MIVYKRKKAPNKKEVSRRKYDRQWKEWERMTFEKQKKEKNKNVWWIITNYIG